jgi:hypothetical protein
MFIRELRHKNGRIYIQVVDKSFGKFKVLKSFGSSLTSDGVLELKKLATIWVNEHQGIREIDFTGETAQIEQMLSGVTQLKLAGIELVLGRIFDEIGFNKIKDELFRSLVLYRLVKTDLKIRPIFHRLQRQIEAHICLTFTAYKVYKELERQLKEKQVPYSATKVIEIAQSIFEIEIKTPKSQEIVRKVLLVNQEQKKLNEFLQFGC